VIGRTAEDLAWLMQGVAARRALPRGPLAIAVAGLADDRRERAERELNALTHACGCGTSAAAALVSLGVAVTYLTSIFARADRLQLAASALLAIVAIGACAAIAKAAGLWIARVRFCRACARLLADLQEGHHGGES
jgi:hypothetical protein